MKKPIYPKKPKKNLDPPSLSKIVEKIVAYDDNLKQMVLLNVSYDDDGFVDLPKDEYGDHLFEYEEFEFISYLDVLKIKNLIDVDNFKLKPNYCRDGYFNYLSIKFEIQKTNDEYEKELYEYNNRFKIFEENLKKYKEDMKIYNENQKIKKINDLKSKLGQLESQ